MKASLAAGHGTTLRVNRPYELQGVPFVGIKGFTALTPNFLSGPAQAPGRSASSERELLDVLVRRGSLR